VRGNEMEVAVQFIRPRHVLKMIGVSRTTLWRMVQAGTFPRPVRITERNRGYLLEAVEAWMTARTDRTLPEGDCSSTSVCGLPVEPAPPRDPRRLADIRPPVLHVTRSAGGL
jgi:prophage regulatory protein